MELSMRDAAERAGMTREGLQRALKAAGIPLRKFSGNALAVELADFEKWLASRPPNYSGKGRPRKRPVD